MGSCNYHCERTQESHNNFQIRISTRFPTNMLVKLHLKATDLKKMDMISGKSDPYFTVTVAGSDEVIFKSAVIEKSLDPEWEEAEFEVPDEFQTKGGEVIVSLFDQDKMSKDEVQAAPVTIKYPFRKADYTLDTQGTLTVVSDYGALV